VEKALIVLNTNSPIYTDAISNKIKQKFEPIIFIVDENLNYSKAKIIELLNRKIKKHYINLGFFQGDYISIIDYNFINNLSLKKKFLYSTDDFDAHEVNCLTAIACDAVFTCCPISLLKFQEKGINAYYLFHESDPGIFKEINIKKKYDVLFYGALKANRAEYLNEIKKNYFNLKIAGPANNEFLNYEDINRLINESKIVIDFSRTGNKKKFYSHKTYPYDYLQLKGRIVGIGMSNSLCISEYAPAQKLIFKKDELLTFKNTNEMIYLIKKLLSNKNYYQESKEKFTKICKEYSDDIYFKKILNLALEKNYKKKNIQMPFWYRRLFNIKLIRLYCKNNSYKGYLNSIYENVLNNFFLFLEYLMYTPYVLLKITINKFKIEK